MRAFADRLTQCLLIGVLLMLTQLPSPGRAAPEARIEAMIAELTPRIAEPAINAIPETGRRLLALRSYLRARKSLRKRWSWTQAEIAAYQGSPEQSELLAEIDRVKAHFADRFPGYQLYTNTRVRSLDVQVERWNENESVGVAAEELLKAFEENFPPTRGSEIDLKKASLWLRAFRLTKRAHLAAPGLTRHGRANAIDFQIMKDGEIYAGADSDQIETRWREQGWAKRLKDSIEEAGPSFYGPLKAPDEPWHFDYQPAPDEPAGSEAGE